MVDHQRRAGVTLRLPEKHNHKPQVVYTYFTTPPWRKAALYAAAACLFQRYGVRLHAVMAVKY
jgi:hypothetical protein